MSVDPVYNGPSGYVGMLNNPISTIDPNGEEPISLTAIAIAVAISGVGYTASIALSDGGFNNWDWGQFGKSVFVGAVSGAITFGIGTEFKSAIKAAASNSSKVAILKVAKVATHATFQGGLSAGQGGDFWTAFASGAVGGAVGLGTENLTGAAGHVTSIGSAMVLGGFTADATGGEFWKGAVVAGIVAGANDVAHRLAIDRGEMAKQKRKAEGANFRARIAKAQTFGSQNGRNNSPSSQDIALATAGTLFYVGEGLSRSISSSRSGFSSGKINPNSPRVYNKQVARFSNGGFRILGWSVIAYSVYNTEQQFDQGLITEGRRELNHLNNGVGVFVPQFAIPMAVGDYFGQQYSNEINATTVEPGGFIYEAFKSTLEFFGIPTGPKK